MSKSSALLLAFACTFASACSDSIEERWGGDEIVDETEDALLDANALNANALNANALNANALNANALNANALSADALAAIEDPGASGDLARQLLKYTVGCALSPAQVFSFAWTDKYGVVHDESWPGELGLEPAWATNPLSYPGRRMVSACLASRVNYYGVSVIISSRSPAEPLKSLTTAVELSNYSNVEGAFWGDLFAEKPWLNACFNDANVINSRANLRDCATGHLLAGGGVAPCGMIKLVGSCKNVCDKLNGGGQLYPACVDQPGVAGSPKTKYVITTALP